MAKEDNIKFDSNEGRFYKATKEDIKRWKEQYPYLDFDDFGKLMKEAGQHLTTRNSYIKDEARKSPRDFLEWYFRRENFLLMPTPSGKQVEIKQREIQTLSELYDFIKQLFATGLTELNKKLSTPNSEPFAKEGYNIALGYAVRLRNSNPEIPQLPQPTSDPITNLRFLQEWTMKAAKAEQNATPAKPEREGWWWKLYEKTLKAFFTSFLEWLGPKP